MSLQLLPLIQQGNTRALARGISIVENEIPGYEELLRALPSSATKIIGITGPPGAGKSTIADGLIRLMVELGRRVGILCVDPSSPFNLGSLLGDRLRMGQWYNNPGVYIRSLATRGSLGGLHPKILEISDLLKAAPFDNIIIETVGVGQSEVEIAGLADTTIVVVVPESGDEIQTMKAGIMEIADMFVVNKADRPGAELLAQNLRHRLTSVQDVYVKPVPVIKTIASGNEGISQLLDAVNTHQASPRSAEKKTWLLAEKAYRLVQNRRMKDIDKIDLKSRIQDATANNDFNLYRFVAEY
jgi:LAO/AO transport system kinase